MAFPESAFVWGDILGNQVINDKYPFVEFT
jgi:hypothetical protein